MAAHVTMQGALLMVVKSGLTPLALTSGFQRISPASLEGSLIAGFPLLSLAVLLFAACTSSSLQQA